MTIESQLKTTTDSFKLRGTKGFFAFELPLKIHSRIEHVPCFKGKFVHVLFKTQ